MNLRYQTVALVLGLFLTLGCSKGGADSVDPYAPEAPACGSKLNLQSGQDSDDGEKENSAANDPDNPDLIPEYCFSSSPTWYGNVLPLINSRIDGQKYQCSTCHDQYKELKVTKRELDEFIKSMRQSGTKFMPRVGDKVPSKCIEMLRAWQDDDHPKGDPDEQKEAVEIEQKRDRERQLAFANGESSGGLKNSGTQNCSSNTKSGD